MAEHQGVPTWVWVVGGGGVAVLAAIWFLGGQQASTPSTNAPAQSSASGSLDTTGLTNAAGTSSGSVPMIPSLDANGAVQTNSWPTGWSTAAPAPTASTSLQNNGLQDFTLNSNAGVLESMSPTGTPTWWVPYTYTGSPTSQPTQGGA